MRYCTSRDPRPDISFSCNTPCGRPRAGFPWRYPVLGAADHGLDLCCGLVTLRAGVRARDRSDSGCARHVTKRWGLPLKQRGGGATIAVVRSVCGARDWKHYLVEPMCKPMGSRWSAAGSWRWRSAGESRHPPGQRRGSKRPEKTRETSIGNAHFYSLQGLTNNASHGTCGLCRTL
jgi:hypothetical protein